MSGFKVEFSVLNLKATPGIYASSLATRPPAGQPGRLFVDTDNPSTGIYRDTGTVWENITGGAGAGNLQTVTDAGNTTDNNILLTYADNTIANALVFYNDALTQEEYLIEKRGTGITTNDSLAIQSRGNISPSTNPVGFLIDGANDIVKSFYTTSYTEVGLKLDFQNQNYYFGDLVANFLQIDVNNGDTSLLCTNQWALSAGSITMQADTQIIKSVSLGNDIGLKLDFANTTYQLGGITKNSINVLDLNTDVNIYFTNTVGDGDALEVLMGTSNHITLGFYNSGNNTVLYLNDDASFIKTAYQSNDVGLKLDFANGQFYLANYINDINDFVGFGYDMNIGLFNIGDLNAIWSRTFLQIDSDSAIIKTSNSNNDVGLKLDFASKFFYFGDFDGVQNQTYLLVNDNALNINTQSGGNVKGLDLDFNSNNYYFGDFNSIAGTSYIRFDAANEQIKLYSGVSQYANIICNNNTTLIGDPDAVVNGTSFGVDDTLETLIGSGNLLVGTSGPVSGQHLKVQIGGVDYVIELKDP